MSFRLGYTARRLLALAGGELGRADEAATRLRKTESWVSQRRALLQLAPELQTALRRGELAIREARSLARVPLEQQVARWRAALDKQDAKNNAGEDNADPTPQNRTPPRSRVIATALGKFESEPNLLAEALRTYLGEEGVKRLLAILAPDTAA